MKEQVWRVEIESEDGITIYKQYFSNMDEDKDDSLEKFMSATKGSYITTITHFEER